MTLAAARRRALRRMGRLALLLNIPALASAANPEATIVAVWIWPARDYTRVTIESDAPLAASHLLTEAPHRLVVDIDGLQLNPALRELVGKVRSDDPFITGVRVGQYQRRVVRLVFDLKTEIKPQVFALKPVGEYGHRLVLDLYPATPPDPLLAFMDKQALPQDMVPRDGDAPAGTQRGEPIVRDGAPKSDSARTDVPRTETAKAESRRDEMRPAKQQVARMITIALDPGHGGEDPGAVGRRGTYEKHVTLAVAKRLKEKIDAEPNMRAMLTRDSDYFVPLGVRVQKARKVEADLFVSIHADAWINPTAKGSSVFALSERGATSSAAGWLAKKENDADLIGGVNLGTHDKDLARVLLDLSTTAQINDSLKVGRAVLTELGNINELHKARVEQAGFAVLKAPDIPSILIETAFISNPEEEKRLLDEGYQDKMALSIMKGIRSYFSKNPPLAKSKLASL